MERTGCYLHADGSCKQRKIPQLPRAGSTIEVIVDQDASTVEFRLDGAPVGKGGTACKLSVKPEHKQDLTPAASVVEVGSALTLVAVEEMTRDAVVADQVRHEFRLKMPAPSVHRKPLRRPTTQITCRRGSLPFFT